MWIAMNRFRVLKGEETRFEEMWRSRESRLERVPGFMAFRLLRGPERADHTLYVSHTEWVDEDSFTAWTRSEAFRAAHGGVAPARLLYLDAPEFEGFRAIQTIAPRPAQE